MLKLMIGVVIATVIVIFAFSVINANMNANPQGQSSMHVIDDNFLSITVTGQVVKPGTYVMKKDETIGDLIMAAGGPTSNADARAYFEETVLVAGVSYYIAPINDLDDYCGEMPLHKVNINTDPKDKLMEVNGIGDTLASAIIQYRGEYGEFTYLEELMKVKGIAKATFEKIKNNVILR
ncbi:MAG: ComE operon protein 1 [Tenericutes bacterium ADurb.Bin087]|nr:MAG: ComE operon protein 1 [Tenericutes bacterium ADurb.Bin087]